MRTSTKVFATVLVTLAATLVLTEIALRKFYGMGNPVLYESYPLYGYRPKPSQHVGRFGEAVVSINNLALRADRDWDANPDGKVLFLGDSVTYGGSYVSNAQLFSSVAVKGIPGLTAGNGGVNAWGVENIHGLVVESGFLPAKTVVTVLPEGDFYRGMSRINGLPFWCRKPRFALQEPLYFQLNRINERRYRNWEYDSSTAAKQNVVDAAAKKLAAMDRFLGAHGVRHLVYITPNLRQVLGQRRKDPLVEAALKSHGIAAVYLLDRLAGRHLSAEATKALYHDRIHLTIAGHALWGEMIGADLRRALQP